MIVECPSCQSRYDVTGRPPGTRARCRCGTVFPLPEPTSEAAALSCPKCGGTVGAQHSRCEFCDAELLVKACPRCFARIFAGAAHCRMCGAKVEVPAAANPDGSARQLRCPRCDDVLEGQLIGQCLIDECPSCHGIWMDAEALERLVEQAAESSVSPFAGTARRGDSGTQATGSTTLPPGGQMYVKCPECEQLMNRKMFARGAKVIIDRCRSHGTWFDAGELPAVVDFVAHGGLGEARKREMRELEEARRRQQSRLPMSSGLPHLGEHEIHRESPVVAALGFIARSVWRS